MQPHVTCAFIFTHYLWVSQRPGFVPRTTERIKISYRNRLGDSVNKYYQLSNFQQNSDKTEYKITMMMDNGGDRCEMTIRRKSARDDAEVTMKHSVQHIAGLEHEFRLGKYEISGGRHFNSRYFKDFGLRLRSQSDPTKFTVTSYALNDSGQYVLLTIDAEIIA
ncbi:hypothetical protein KA082_01865 [Candidatus Woesebacteria bacterium]|nr:hypothetical protein [Candidatus Woesebacteria bacterium]